MPDTLRILYVDDEKDLLDLGKLFLEESGDISVTTIDSAPEALTLLQKEKFDAVISDYQMPKMDGIQFLIEVRKMLGTFPFILFTGKGREYVVIQAINNGVDFYLQKGGEPEAQFAELSHMIMQATSRKRAEEALVRSEAEARYRADDLAAMMDAMPAITFVSHDPQCRSMTSSRVAYELLDLPHSSNTSLSAPPEERPVTFRPLKDGRELSPEELPVQRAAATGQEIRNYELTLELNDGTRRTIFGNAVPLFDESEQTRGAIGSFIDITEIRQAEIALAESEEKYRALFQNLQTGVVVHSPDTGVLFSNPMAAQILGLTSEQMQGKKAIDPYWCFIREDGTQMPLEEYPVNLALSSDKPPSNMILGILRPDREGPTWVQCDSHPVRGPDGTLRQIVITFVDISDRKRVEDALRKSEEKYRMIDDASLDYIYSYDLGGHFTSANRSLCTAMMLRSDQILGRTHAELGFPDAQCRDWDDLHTKVYNTGTTVTSLTSTPMPDGSIRHYEVVLNPLHDSQGMITGIAGTTRDITDRKRADDALRTLAEGRYGTDDDLLRDLVRQLALSQGTQYALIARIYPDDPGTAHTLAVWAGSDFGDNFRYSLDGTPCENVSVKGTCLYYRDIRQLFPRDQILADMNAESYWGTPLQDKDGQKIGILAIIDIKPIKEHPQALALLKSFAIRASQELQRMQAEETLRNSEEYYRTILQTTKDGFWTLDAHTGRFLDVNETYCKMSGYSKAEILDMGINDIDCIEDPAKTQERIRHIITNGSDLFETRHRRKDGSTFAAEISVTYFPAEAGKFICFCRDITRRKQAEEELAESEEKFRTLFESMTPGVFYQRSDGVLIDINPAALSMFGLSREQFMGRDSYDPRWKVVSEAGELLPPEQHPSMIALQSGKQVKDLIVGVYNPQTEEITWLSTNAEPQFRSGEATPYQVFVTMYDITERKRAEDALAEMEQRFRQVFNTLPIGMWIADRNGKLLMGNPAGQDIWEAHPQVGQDEYRIFKAWRLPSHEPVLPDEWALGYAVNEGRVTTKELLEIEAFNGSHKFILNWAAPVKNDAGEITGAFVLNQDITDSVMSERALQESESFLNILLEAIPIPVFYKDREGRYLGFNKAFENFYGKSKEQLMGKSVFDISPPELAKIYHAADTGLFEKPGIQVYDSQVLDSHGILHDVIFHKASLTDNQGSVTGLIGAILDITERKVAEQALRETEANYRQVINTIDETLSVIDPDGNFLFANNNAALNLSGGTPEDVTGKNIREFVPCGQAELLIEKYRSVVASGQPVKGDIRISLKSGERWFSNVLQPLHYGQTKIPAVLSISLDITERKLAEVALKESEERFKSYIENSPEGVFIADERGCYLEVNPGACSITGYEKEELLAMQISDILPPESTEAGLKHFKELIEYGYAFGELLFRHKDGSLRYWSVDAVRLTPTRFIGFVKDITKRKVAEESLRVANKKLKLLSGITRHDISNQITVLMGYLRMLEKKQPETMHNEYFLKINAAAQRIWSMIEFTREYEYIGVKAPAWHDCRTLADTAAKDAPFGKVIVKNDLPAGAEVFADPLVVNVFYNLMDNAVRYGGKITTIRFSVEEREGVHIVVCEDDGDGVVADEKEKILERGFGKNTGLGLALSREILDITGINIRETGEPGKGARFEMTVPNGVWRSSSNPENR